MIFMASLVASFLFCVFKSIYGFIEALCLNSKILKLIDGFVQALCLNSCTFLNINPFDKWYCKFL